MRRSKEVILLIALAAMFAVLTAYSAPVAPSGITFTLNTSANYANSSFAVNWTPNDIADPASNYAVYVFNSSSFVLKTSNTSQSGYFFSSAANNGNYTFNISAVNSTGSEGANSTSPWIFVDMQAPVVALMGPANLSINDSSTIIFEFNATDNGPSFNCSVNLDGSIIATNSSVTNNTATRLSASVTAGTHAWNISCRDPALNANTSLTRILYSNLNPPSITLNNPVNGIWQNPDNNVTFNYTVSDELSLKNCLLYITDALNQNFAYNQTNSSALINGSSANSFVLNLTTAGQSNYTWNVECFDIGNKSAFASANETFFVGKRPDLIIGSIAVSDSSNNASQLNPIAGGYITFNVTVQNNGTYLAEQPINVSFYWDGTLINTVTITSSIDSGSYSYTAFNISGGNVSTSKPYTAMAAVDPSNSIPETNESNNALSRTILTGLNVSILELSPTKPAPGTPMFVNLSVNYFNGTPVTTLQQANITSLFDMYEGAVKNASITILNFNRSNNATGNYWFNFTAPARNSLNRAYPGNHTLAIFVADNSTGTYYDNAWAVDGMANSTSKYFDLQAPNLEIEFDGLVSSMDISSIASDAFNVRVKNNGTTNISGINISITSSLAGSLFLSGGNYSAGIMCNYTATIAPANTFVTVCSPTFNVSATGSNTLAAVAGGVDSNSTLYNSTTITQYVNATNSSSTSTAESTSSSASSVPAATYVYSLNFTNYSKTVLIEQGGSNTANFSIKNTGNGTINNISLALTLPETVSWGKSWYTPANISKIYAGGTTAMQTTITVPASTAVASYTLTAKASGAETGSSKTTTFTVQVTPGNETKKSLNFSLEDIESQILELNSTIAQLMKDNNSTSIAVASKKLAEVRRLLSEAKQAISNGDYLAAYNARNEINAIIPEIRQIIADEKQVVEESAKKKQNIIIWVVIILAIAGVIYYSWMPEEGYTPGKGFAFRPKGTSGILKQLEEKWGQLISNISNKAAKTIRKKDDASPKSIAQKEQPYNFSPKNEKHKFGLKQMKNNIIEQLNEQKKEKKLSYNFHKKERWSND